MIRRPSPATLLAVVALVLACAGTATAASLITSAQVKNNSLRSIDVKNQSLKLRDIAPKTRTALQTGGAQGTQGPQGPKGDPGISGYETLSESSASNSSPKSVTVECPAGKKALSAGGSVPVGSAQLINVRVSDDGSSAIVAASDNPDNGTAWALTGRVVCADVG